MKDLFSLRLSDLPEGCRPLAAYIGLPLFLELIETFGGETFYIPKLGQMQEAYSRRALRDEEIRASYHGGVHEVSQLSRKYRLSARQIRNIVREPKEHR